jgi:hypothetical protein
MKGNRWTVDLPDGKQVVYERAEVSVDAEGALVVIEPSGDLWRASAYYAPGAWSIARKQAEVTLKETYEL